MFAHDYDEAVPIRVAHVFDVNLKRCRDCGLQEKNSVREHRICMARTTHQNPYKHEDDPWKCGACGTPVDCWGQFPRCHVGLRKHEPVVTS